MWRKSYITVQRWNENTENRKNGQRKKPHNNRSKCQRIFSKSIFGLTSLYTKKVLNATKIFAEVTIIFIKAILKGWENGFTRNNHNKKK